MVKQTIAETLYRYCRSLDRLDVDLFATVFLPGATIDFGGYFSGPAEEFQSWVWAALGGMPAHSHQITNILVEVDGARSRAVSEAYVTVSQRTKPGEAGEVDVVDLGRYLDRWTRTDGGDWRIAARRFCSDIQQVTVGSSSPPTRGLRDRSDPSYELFALPS